MLRGSPGTTWTRSCSTAPDTPDDLALRAELDRLARDGPACGWSTSSATARELGYDPLSPAVAPGAGPRRALARRLRLRPAGMTHNVPAGPARAAGARPPAALRRLRAAVTRASRPHPHPSRRRPRRDARPSWPAGGRPRDAGAHRAQRPRRRRVSPRQCTRRRRPPRPPRRPREHVLARRRGHRHHHAARAASRGSPDEPPGDRPAPTTWATASCRSG